jgi:hypothetical protein
MQTRVWPSFPSPFPTTLRKPPSGHNLLMATAPGIASRTLLPVETMKAVVDLVDNKGDLAALALANAMFSSLATSKLYTEYVTLRALGVLLARPDLAMLVNSVSIEGLYAPAGYSVQEADEAYEDEIGLSDDLPLIPTERQIEEFALCNDDDVLGALKRKFPNARAILLLHLLPSLQELRIVGESNGWCLQYDRFLRIFPEPGSPPMAAGLRGLTSLDISWSDESSEGGLEPELVVRLLALPCLLRLRMCPVWGNEFPPDLEARLPELYGTSSVMDLAFTYSGIDAEVLPHLVRIPRALSSFEYHHDGPLVYDVEGWGNNSAGKIAAALAPARETLVKLVIEDPLGDLGIEAVGSLEAFKKLVEIKIPESGRRRRDCEV